jgi:hypothetical protein
MIAWMLTMLLLLIIGVFLTNGTQQFEYNGNPIVYINTRTSIIQHLYCEIVKKTMKMILVAVTMIFCVSMMNKLYYS